MINSLYKFRFISLACVTVLILTFLQTGLKAQENSADEWLQKMADAVISPGTTLKTITVELEQVILTPMGEVTVEGTSTLNYETGEQYALLDTPQGKVEVSVQGDKGVQKVGGQEYPMNGAQIQQIKTEMERNYLNVALNNDSMDSEYLGTETIDDTEYAKVKINFTVPVTYYLDTETALPSMLRYTQFNQQTGGEIEVEVRNSDWQTVSGVTYAFSTTSYAGGQQAGSATINDLKVNEES